MAKSGNRPTWSARYVSRLPDSAFALVKRAKRATTPKPTRLFHHHDATVKSATDNDTVSLPHLRNALARVEVGGVSGVTEAERNRARKHLRAHAVEWLQKEGQWDGALYALLQLSELAGDSGDIGKRISTFTESVAGKIVGFNDIMAGIEGDIYRDFMETELITGVDDWTGETYAYTVDYPKYFIVDMFADWVLLESYDEGMKEWKLWRLPYSVADDEAIVADWGALVEVRREVEYIPKQSGGAFYNYKGADGRWYWVSISGSSFVDRDLEIISTKSLDEAVLLADTSGKRGELDIYHVAGTDVGDCLAQCMVGNFLVEAGVWHDTDLAVAARKWTEEHGESVGVSIMFAYDPKQKVRSVYYGPIEIVKRSILLQDDAACPWSGFWNATDTEVMSMGTIADVAKVVGEELADAIEKQAAATTEELVGSKVMFKEVAAEAAATEGDTEATEEVESKEEATEAEAEVAEGEEVEVKAEQDAEQEAESQAEQEDDTTEKEGDAETLFTELVESEPLELVLGDEALKAIAGATTEGMAESLVQAFQPITDAIAALSESMKQVEALGVTVAAIEKAMDVLLEDDAAKVQQMALGRSKAMIQAQAVRPTKRVQALKEAATDDVTDPDAETAEAKKIDEQAKLGIPALHRLRDAGLGGSMAAIQQERE